MDTDVNFLFVFCLVADKIEGKGRENKCIEVCTEPWDCIRLSSAELWCCLVCFPAVSFSQMVLKFRFLYMIFS